MICPYGNARCLCQTCQRRAEGRRCSGSCGECLSNNKMMHDIYMCSAYIKEKPKGDADDDDG